MSALVVRRLDVRTDGEEPQVLEIPPRTVLAWEKAHRNRSAVLLDGEAVRIEYLYEIAWIALGKPGDDFEKWAARTDVWEASEQKQDSTVDPTSPEASTTTS